MKIIINNLCKTIAGLLGIDPKTVLLIVSTGIILLVFKGIKIIGIHLIARFVNNKNQFNACQIFKLVINTIEVLSILFLWANYLSNMITLISVLSAAMTIALREVILNFFSGIYIKIKKPFKVEDRIQIDEIKGDVINISAFDFEILEVSNGEQNGQSTGVIITYPNSIIFSKPVKNENKGFKYIWVEQIIKLDLESDINNIKKELYQILNSNDVIKSIPQKCKNQVKTNIDAKIYFNNFEPVIYTKIVDDHLELTLRYLMHPKKCRNVENQIWLNIHQKYKEGKIVLHK